MLRKLIVWNNSCFGCEHHAEIEIETGKVFYKTNMPTNGKTNYECFFLLPKENTLAFAKKVDFITRWQPIYRPEAAENNGIILDGFRWSVRTDTGLERLSEGYNRKPEDFDLFIAELETLLQKDFGGQWQQQP